MLINADAAIASRINVYKYSKYGVIRLHILELSRTGSSFLIASFRYKRLNNDANM